MENIVYSQKALDKQNAAKIIAVPIPEFSAMQLLVFKNNLTIVCEELIKSANELYLNLPNKELYDSIVILNSAQKSLNLIDIEQNE